MAFGIDQILDHLTSNIPDNAGNDFVFDNVAAFKDETFLLGLEATSTNGQDNLLDVAKHILYDKREIFNPNQTGDQFNVKKFKQHLVDLKARNLSAEKKAGELKNLLIAMRKQMTHGYGIEFSFRGTITPNPTPPAGPKKTNPLNPGLGGSSPQKSGFGAAGGTPPPANAFFKNVTLIHHSEFAPNNGKGKAEAWANKVEIITWKTDSTIPGGPDKQSVSARATATLSADEKFKVGERALLCYVKMGGTTRPIPISGDDNFIMGGIQFCIENGIDYELPRHTDDEQQKIELAVVNKYNKDHVAQGAQVAPNLPALAHHIQTQHVNSGIDPIEALDPNDPQEKAILDKALKKVTEPTKHQELMAYLQKSVREKEEGADETASQTSGSSSRPSTPKGGG